jgi:glycine cleavage system H protein
VNVPDDRRYTRDHEWVVIDGGEARLGITDYAQEALGDVVFVSLPPKGRRVATGDTLGELESTKSVAEVYAPLTGIVADSNAALAATPELVNQDPYGAGWLVTLVEAEGVENLLDAAAYRLLIG